jgi:hypothetical protein
MTKTIFVMLLVFGIVAAAHWNEVRIRGLRRLADFG